MDFQQKRQGHECHFHSCSETFMLHGITWKCYSGHINILRYCGKHINRMMELALAPSRSRRQLDGSYIGQALCHECLGVTRAVMEHHDSCNGAS